MQFAQSSDTRAPVQYFDFIRSHLNQIKSAMRSK